MQSQEDQGVGRFIGPLVGRWQNITKLKCDSGQLQAAKTPVELYYSCTIHARSDQRHAHNAAGAGFRQSIGGRYIVLANYDEPSPTLSGLFGCWTWSGSNPLLRFNDLL